MNTDYGVDPGLLSLSQVLGQNVLGPDGHVVGHLADLSVALDTRTGPHLVQRLLVCRRQSPDLLLPWAAVKSFEHFHVTVGSDVHLTAAGDGIDDLVAEEILLARDVLDTQIVDVVGQRLARVADVTLSRNADGLLGLVGVEVSFGGVLRRLGLPWLADRTREDVVAWTDLHLTSARGHTVQLATPRSAVHHLDAAGLAALVQRLDTQSAAEVLSMTGPRVAAEAVRVADPTVGERVLRALPRHAAAEVVAAMPAQHATRWRNRLSHAPAFFGRRFLRSRVWQRHRHRRTPGSE